MPFSTQSRLVRRLFQAPATRPITRSAFKPSLEALDTRAMPALFTWTDATFDNQFSDPSNWTNTASVLAIPGPGDDLLFTNFAGSFGGPTTGGGIGTGGGSPGDCYGMQSNGGPFNSIFVTAGYTGTITLPGPVQTLALCLESGTIDQPLPSGGSDITVLGGEVPNEYTTLLFPQLGGADFNWTGGTLNSTSNLANINISGANAVIAPQTGPLLTGDTINFLNGATGTLEQGEVDTQNNPEINIEDGSKVTALPVTIDSTVDYVGVKQINVIGKGSYFWIDGPGTFPGTNTSLYNHSGSVGIKYSGTLSLGGSVTVGTTVYNASYYQDGDSSLQIWSGSTLQTQNQTQISGGLLTTRYSVNYPDTVADQTATIAGSLYMTDGYLKICTGSRDDDAIHYGTLKVIGTIDLEGGTYAPVVDGTTSGHSDNLYSTVGISIDQAANSSATLTVIDPAGLDTIKNGIWKILSSRVGGILGNFATTNLQYAIGPPVMSFTLGKLGDPTITDIIVSS